MLKLLPLRITSMGLRKLYIAETRVCSLKALRTGSESYGRILVSVLLHKFPPEQLQLHVSREVGEDQCGWMK